ncbi:DUF7266 family protein [Methanococcoides alaskense]|uniref:Uncharacterized protein n=1 Tax=Methanococcoides alaskense TaxID=325778 RepID=A0AA90TXF7_9EURY|nr:hypothetical protein [Methanococcoides alaskense]MDA0525212.1 hypothetical protein [Methanococcoides alaskense]MDR6221865.1 hypothetical protein [Methanococcoides alaskense]
MKQLYTDNKAVSTSVGFILTFVITIITFILVMQSSYGLMDQAEHTVMREEFEIHGNNIALQLTKIDTMVGIVNNGGGEIVEHRSELMVPIKIANEYYYVEFSNQTREIIFESNERSETRVQVAFDIENTNIMSTTLSSASGDHFLLYNSTSNVIEIY